MARDLAVAAEDLSERIQVYRGLWSGSFVRGDLAPMQGVAAAFLRDVAIRPASPEAGEAHGVNGETHWYEGNFVEARRHLEQALAIHVAMQDWQSVFQLSRDVITPDRVHLALTLWGLGIVDRAHALIEQAITHALATRHVGTIAFAHAHATTFHMIRRDRERSVPHLETLLALANEHGMSEWIALGTFGGGWLRSGSVDREAGIAQMREGLAPMRLRQQELFMPLLMTLLAEADTEAGHPDAGLAIIDNQLATIERTRQRWYLSELHRMRGEILLKCRPSDAAEAESALMHAVETARDQSAKLFELQAAVSWHGCGLSKANERRPIVCSCQPMAGSPQIR